MGTREANDLLTTLLSIALTTHVKSPTNSARGGINGSGKSLSHLAGAEAVSTLATIDSNDALLPGVIQQSNLVQSPYML